jgi:hypothetical protein
MSRFGHALEKRREEKIREEKTLTKAPGVLSVGEIIARGAKA